MNLCKDTITDKVQFTVLGSGSAGNASVIHHGETTILIDAGFSAKRLAERLRLAGLDPDRIDAILITHEHSDHVNGIRVFCKRHGTTVYANSLTAERLMHLKKAPEQAEQLVVFNNGTPFDVGPFQIEPFSISHDAVDPVGFRLEIAGRRVGVATDLGHAGKMVPLKLRDCDLLLIEANHCPRMLRDSKRPMHLKHRILGRRGHLSNEHGADLISRTAGPVTKYIVVGHISEECNDHKLVHRYLTECLDGLARTDIEFLLAQQHEVSQTVFL